jgi:hypothetical protein
MRFSVKAGHSNFFVHRHEYTPTANIPYHQLSLGHAVLLEILLAIESTVII